MKAPMKSIKNPNLPTFSGELPTPKGEAEIDNYLFQIKLLRSSYTEHAIRNAIVATVRGHAKIAIPGPGTSAAGPFRKDKPPVQCYQCTGWGHYSRNCPNDYPLEGSINWENQKGEAAKKGGTLPQQSNTTQTQNQVRTSTQPDQSPPQ